MVKRRKSDSGEVVASTPSPVVPTCMKITASTLLKLSPALAEQIEGKRKYVRLDEISKEVCIDRLIVLGELWMITDNTRQHARLRSNSVDTSADSAADSAAGSGDMNIK